MDVETVIIGLQIAVLAALAWLKRGSWGKSALGQLDRMAKNDSSGPVSRTAAAVEDRLGAIEQRVGQALAEAEAATKVANQAKGATGRLRRDLNRLMKVDDDTSDPLADLSPEDRLILELQGLGGAPAPAPAENPAGTPPTSRRRRRRR